VRNLVVSTLALLLLLNTCLTAGAEEPIKFARFQTEDGPVYGVVDGDQIHQIEGEPFGEWEKTDTTHSLDSVKLLVPSEPRQVLALAGNYRSHIHEGQSTTIVTTTTIFRTDADGERTEVETRTETEERVLGEVPERFQIPQPFFKSISSLVAHGEDIVLPHDAEDVHFEAELVIVIGKEATNVSREEALDYVWGVTCGNDVSARRWQRSDVQWWRAKGADTFGPVGPYIVSGLDYDDLLLQLRLNGEVMQKERTSNMIQDVPTQVSFISQYVTLYPGDMIFTGTPGTTSAMQPGDVVEVELEGVGVLRNNVVAESR
jgi:2-keto-4-pentenoate hydratase/2-oxohepta-3-ene-1,7-dioic acid hydratase in catechol pathway